LHKRDSADLAAEIKTEDAPADGSHQYGKLLWLPAESFAALNAGSFARVFSTGYGVGQLKQHFILMLSIPY
jgi:hypothetical protein